MGQARTCQKKGEFEKAQEAFSAALRLEPDNPDVLGKFAWFLATCPDRNFRDGKKALEFVKKAREINPGDHAWSFQVVAAVHAEIGNFPEAVQWQQRALDKSTSAGKKLNELKERLKLYEDKKPYRESIK